MYKLSLAKQEVHLQKGLVTLVNQTCAAGMQFLIYNPCGKPIALHENRVRIDQFKTANNKV